jgi:hypothetical protein
VSVNLNIPYSAQYNTMNKEGHECPPPVFGAPTLVWHLGISPHEVEKRVPRDAPLKESHEEAAKEYDRTRRDFFRDVNTLLRMLQEPIRHPRGAPWVFVPDCVPRPWVASAAALGDPFRVTEPEHIRFTLWWPDVIAQAHPEPTVDALRIKVHATAYRDYVTLSFYLDAGKPWDRSPFIRGDATVGDRRRRIFQHVQTVYDKCEPRLAGSHGARPMVEKEILPELDISATDAADLMQSSRFLYTELWDELWGALRIPPMETSALVTQISATRQNTAELRSIANAVASAHVWLNQAIFWLRLFSALVAVAALFLGTGGFSGLQKLFSWILERFAQ